MKSITSKAMTAEKLKMNSTSFTSVESDTGCVLGSDKMANIDSSSTAHLTLNAAGSLPPLRGSTRGSINSDSDPEKSPSVMILKAENMQDSSSSPDGERSHLDRHHHHHHLHYLGRPAHLVSSGFSFSTRLHLTKHQRTIWSRATHFEKLLMLAVILLATTTILLLITIISLLMSQANQSHLYLNNRTSTRERLPHESTQPQSIRTGTDGSKTPTEVVQVHGESGNESSKRYCLTPDCVKVAASVIEAIDLTVDPCDDFYMYSCGDWIKSNPLPDGKSNWGTFSKLWQDNQSIMRSVLEGVDFEPGSAEEKAKIYYESCLDRNDTVETRGTKPMEDLIESAGGWNMSGTFNVNSWDLQKSLQIYHNQYNRGGLFSWAVGADERNSTKNIIQLDQGGLGLPSRDYYLNKTDKNIVLEAYLLYMEKVAELMGGGNIQAQMKDMLEFETRLAGITVPQDQRRDDERMYHKFTLRELNRRSPFLNWTKYFDDAFDYHSRTTISFSSEIRPRINSSDIVAGLESNQTRYSVTQTKPNETLITMDSPAVEIGNQKQTISKHKITDDESIVIYSPEYFENLSALVIEYTKTDRGKIALANYMAWSVIQSLIATLPKNFRDASRILRKALIGSEGIEVSWRYCVTDTNQVMGFALGSLFVRRVFEGKSKERAEEMIYSIRNAFKDNLSNLSWMDDRTRMLAREKADYINQMIGFPDFILNPEKLNGKYEGLELDKNNYFENNIKVNVLSLRENMEKINKPAIKTEWEMTPPMVNAYYTPTKNQIVFPAGILQTPFYDLSYPNSLNYGAMGVVMGHELTHAFDDQGREYDKDGNLYQWWYNETLKNFEERVKCFVDQYSSYRVDDNNLNGKQTLGENIADNGGLKAAFRAFEKWSEQNPEPRLPGLSLTGKQLFFVGFAQVWCSISTPEALKLQVLNDPHAPAQFRVIGTLSNSNEFAREFNCPLGSRMNPEKKCVVW